MAGADGIWPRDVSNGNLERIGWHLKRIQDTYIPEVITSSVVYSSKSPAIPGKSMSFLLKGVSFPVLGSWYGAVWFCRTTISGKMIFRELHASRNEKVSIVGGHHVLTLHAVSHE